MAGTVAFWFRRKYLLPPTDPRFLDATLDDMLVDFWAWHYAEHPDADKEVVDDGFDMAAELAAADAEADDLPDDFEDVT